jgi:SHS2 domain-containing protein
MPEPRFEILEHTADLGIRVTAPTLEELFAAAAEALVSVTLDPAHIEPKHEYPIQATGEDLEALLVNWLNEIVYLLDGARVAPATINVDELANTRVRGRAFGEPRDIKRHPHRIMVKAATYHQLRLERTAGQWEADIFLDV